MSEVSKRLPNDDESLSDPERLLAVRTTGLLGSPTVTAVDQLTYLAADLLQAPMAFLTLVDEKTSFWLSCVGVEASGAERGNPVEESFCQYLIADAAPFLVEDAAAHPGRRTTPRFGCSACARGQDIPCGTRTAPLSVRSA